MDSTKAFQYLEQFRTIFRRRLQMKTCALVKSRRCPIVKIQFNASAKDSEKSEEKSGIDCDINITNGLGVNNTKLIHLYTRLESRFQQLAAVLRFWAKKNGFIDGSTGFTSYALTQLVIFFCQTISPQLLPSLEQLSQMTEESVVIDGIECKFCKDLDLIPKSQNKESVIELLKTFFKFYANFDFTTQVIRPKTGQSIHKKDFFDTNRIPNPNPKGSKEFKMTSFICIEDPFDSKHNLTANTTYEVFDQFLEYVKYLSLNSDIIFIQNKSGNDANDWGISKIITKFDPTEGYQPLYDSCIYNLSIRQIFSRRDLTAVTMIEESFHLMTDSIEKVFKIRPKLVHNVSIAEEDSSLAEFELEFKAIDWKIFDSILRSSVRRELKFPNRTKRNFKIENEMKVTEEIIRRFGDKDDGKDGAKGKTFKCFLGLMCYSRHSSPFIELCPYNVCPKKANIDKILNELLIILDNCL